MNMAIQQSAIYVCVYVNVYEHGNALSSPANFIFTIQAAVLTAIDALRSRPNVLLLTTSNVGEAIDVAFLDRADIKAHVG